MDISGTQSISYYVHHPTLGQFNITRAENPFDFSKIVRISIGGNYDDETLFNQNNNFIGEFAHIFQYEAHVNQILPQVMKFNKSNFLKILVFISWLLKHKFQGSTNTEFFHILWTGWKKRFKTFKVQNWARRYKKTTWNWFIGLEAHRSIFMDLHIWK